jgi:hypothetical protein
MSEPKNEVVALLRGYAQKIASSGAPDRLTVADGQGGISTHAAQPKKDGGEAELKQDQPADGTMRTSNTPSSTPDRLNVADGQGGISTNGAQPKKDPGEEELKKDQPADGAVRKSAGVSDRVNVIRKAISGANPNLAPVVQQKAATAPAATQAPTIDLSQDTLAKIASAILATEEGINFTHSLFEKQAGEAAARQQIQEAIMAAQAYDDTEQVKSAAINDAHTKAASVYNDLQGTITEAEADEILKVAHVHQEAIIAYDSPLLKQAYAAGMDDAALMEAADEAGGAEGAAPVDEALPMGGETLSEEEIMALLEEMIASGEITEEDVMAALQATEGGEGAPAPEGEEAPPEGGLPMV